MSSRYIFITGGVVSSLGKGIAAASLAALLQARGYSVRLKKLDPYLNVDPGTMSPFQHGEVFVTDDGAETDLDIGHYERFTDVSARKGDSVSAGKIYSELLTKERRGDYLGGTVQVIPHVTNLIKDFILNGTDDSDFTICEIGGTVGDIEAQPFCEAIRQLGNAMPNQCVYIHVTLVPYIAAAKELKTKPTQHSVKELRSIGIQPNILLCRSDREIPKDDRHKMALFCNVPFESIIPALDNKNIYRVVTSYHQEGLDTQVLKHFGLEHDSSAINLDKWHQVIEKVENPHGEVKVAIVGKYNKIEDSYKSLIEALEHAGIANQHKVKIKWITASALKEENIKEKLADIDAILVPGGFGARGTEGKILAINHARLNNIPFFGICLGMQLAVIEYARNVLDIVDASSSEFTSECSNVIAMMSEWDKDGQKEVRAHNEDLGGSMRLGAYDCMIKENSKVHEVYGSTSIQERHRHRYEFNNNFREAFSGQELEFSGLSPDGKLVEIVEIKKHPWFLAVQFHPELKSRPFSPHPLFTSFIKAAINK